MADEQHSVTVQASFPAIQSAIKVGDDGMRILLHIPESEMAEALWLVMMRDKLLRVTIEIADDDGPQPISRRKAKRRE